MDGTSESIKRVYFVGIKGVAMTALVILCKEMGMEVSGSDVSVVFPTEESLKKAGIASLAEFSPSHISQTQKPDLVIYTGAHNGKENVEVKQAISLGIPVMAHGEALGMFMEGHTQVSVAGSHGKTTTSAMIATILSVSQKDPSYAIGCGEIRGLGSPGHFGKGEVFVAEADEYMTDPCCDTRPRFMWQHPDILVVTNVDYDHPDAYTSLAEVKKAFIELQKQQVGKRITIINADDKESDVLLSTQGITPITYGISKKAQLHIDNIQFQEGKTTFVLRLNGMEIDSFTLHIPGAHNVTNAAAAAYACSTLNVSWNDIKKGLNQFGGTKRRFETVGEKNGATIIDDYAHHPKEIAVTLKGCREWYPKKRILVVFQPHTYSRTKSLLHEFASSFSYADTVVIGDIYASARETKMYGVTSEILVEEISKVKSSVFYGKDYEHVKTILDKTIQPGDIVIFMGAGDIYEWSRRYVKE